MGKIDISADLLVKWLVASATGHRREIHSARAASVSYTLRHMAGLASVRTVLKMAIEDRDHREQRSARGIVESGEAVMANVHGEPPFWRVCHTDCSHPWASHILYGVPSPIIGEGRSTEVICPRGRCYWQLARILLKWNPDRLRAIARETAATKAPIWGGIA